ncbi:rab11 family-interacting protein 1 isoform X2 [Rhineura floridana]|uniref:rab11 family-interacting protein 1 isoform X2 n=1 Tax=Rhineura floridana TaxID=261503 RepID=UPI002AC81F0D|nr:rab11 family-interacting protein 1 isoform X2 [Rhineura floridana]
MSLPGSPVSLGPQWAPTHVQVTVLQAQGLRSKAKGGSGGGGGGGGSGSDAYAVMALGKEKFATSVAERCLGSPVWREEATFELPPPPRRSLSGAGLGAGPTAVLQLTVLHRALLGLDKFLGRAEISLTELQTEGGRRSTRWYKLHSKPGKKEKERGKIEVDIQFMRSNMTASMFDLSMKDKSRTPFGKLKDKLKGKRGNGLPETASAIIPSISHSPADSEEESNEKEKKKSKFKTLFSKPGLQKNNLSQSMSVLPSLQPVTERVRLRPSDFQSQWGDDDDDDDTLTPVSESMSHKRTGSADSKQLSQISSGNTKKDTHSLFGGLKSKTDPTSRSNVCINGSHVYVEESKSDTLPKDGTPSSPQISQRKRLFSSQENLSSEPSKEPEMTGRLPPDKGPPASSSLESFKAMTLPSYKLLSGGDFLESNTPVISDTPKETKENKKQENKKSGLLSLMTGKKEAKISEEVENSADTCLKVKEVKRNEKESAWKETNPFEVPVDCKRGHGPDKSSTADLPAAKASLNPFDENITAEEKSEKSSASVKPSQTKLVKPRLGVSSEDETKAAFTISAPSSASLSFPSHHSNNENNPFTSKLDPEQKPQGSDRFVSDNNPFTRKWAQKSKEQDSECFCSPSLAGNENKPFAPERGQESQIEDSSNSAKSPLYSLPLPATSVELHPPACQLSNIDNPPLSKLGKESESFNSPPTSFTSSSLAGNLDDSKHLHIVLSEKPQNKGLVNKKKSESSFPGSLSEGHPARFYDRVGLLLKSQYDDKVHIVPPFKENNGNIKKSVTFALNELKDDAESSGNEASDDEEDSGDEDPVKRWHHDENEVTVNPTERNGRQRLELDVEHVSAPEPHDERVNSLHKIETPLEGEAEASSVKAEPPVPTPRVLMLLPKETDAPRTVLDSSSLSTPPKPAPRSALKTPKGVCVPLTAECEIENGSSSASVSKEFSAGNSSLSSKKLTSAGSPATSISTICNSGRDNGTMDSSQSINTDHSNYTTNTQAGILVPGDLNVKHTTLPVIPEVGSDDEHLSDYPQGVENMAACGDLSRSGDDSAQLWSSIEETSNKKAIGERQTTLLLVKKNGPDDAFKVNKPLVNPSAPLLQNATDSVRGLQQKNGDSFMESRQGDRPGFSVKPVHLTLLPISSHSISSFQSDAFGSNRAESTKKGTAEGLDAKVDISGKKKLLQARVSPSETHPNQTPQSDGIYPAKLRLHPVKPMNATPNKQPAKTLSITKILDNQNETNLKKYDPSDPAYAYAQLTHDELIQLVLKQKGVIAKRDHQVRELEDYIDNLLVRVMEETPNILRVQAHVNKKAGKM